LVILLLLATPRLVTAQSFPTVVLSGGYQAVVYSGPSNDGTFVFVSPVGTTRITQSGFGAPTYAIQGWYVDVAGNLGRHVALVGEVTGNYDKSLHAFGFSSVHQFLAGVRLLRNSGRRLVPHGHVLTGLARSSVTRDDLVTAAVSQGLNPSASAVSRAISGTPLLNSAPALNVGVGVDLMLNSTAGLRVGGSYVHLFTDSVARRDVGKFTVGIVVRR
jgi:hypothetical protein